MLVDWMQEYGKPRVEDFGVRGTLCLHYQRRGKSLSDRPDWRLSSLFLTVAQLWPPVTQLQLRAPRGAGNTSFCGDDLNWCPSNTPGWAATSVSLPSPHHISGECRGLAFIDTIGYLVFGCLQERVLHVVLVRSFSFVSGQRLSLALALWRTL